MGQRPIKDLFFFQGDVAKLLALQETHLEAPCASYPCRRWVARSLSPESRAIDGPAGADEGCRQWKTTKRSGSKFWGDDSWKFSKFIESGATVRLTFSLKKNRRGILLVRLFSVKRPAVVAPGQLPATSEKMEVLCIESTMPKMTHWHGKIMGDSWKIMLYDWVLLPISYQCLPASFQFLDFFRLENPKICFCFAFHLLQGWGNIAPKQLVTSIADFDIHRSCQHNAEIHFWDHFSFWKHIHSIQFHVL